MVVESSNEAMQVRQIIRQDGGHLRVRLVGRIGKAEFQASRAPKDPEVELFDRFPLTDNDSGVQTHESGLLLEDSPSAIQSTAQ